MKLNKVFSLLIISIILISFISSETEMKNSRKIKRNKSKSNSKLKLKFNASMKAYSKFVAKKAGTLTLDDLVKAADNEKGFNDRLRHELENSPVHDDLRITRIRLLQNKPEYGVPLTIRGYRQRFTHQSIVLCIKTYTKPKRETQDGLDNKQTAYFFLFERMVQQGMPDIRFQYLGYDEDCRDGITSTANNWKVAEMFTLNADIEAAIKVNEENKEEAAKLKKEVMDGIKEFFIEKAKEQAAWLVGHAALSAAHATGIGIVVSGPIHLIYGAAHAIHTAVSSASEIINALQIGKNAAVAAYLEYVINNPYQEKIENDKVKDNPKGNRSVLRFINAINRYETDEDNFWDVDYSDSRTFATGFYNAIKKGHEDESYVDFKKFKEDKTDDKLHAKKYFYGA